MFTCLFRLIYSFSLSLSYSELWHSLCSVQWTSKGSFTSSWSMLTPSCFLKKTVGFVLTLKIIIITDTLDIDNTAWNRFYHFIVRTVSPKVVFWKPIVMCTASKDYYVLVVTLMQVYAFFAIGDSKIMHLIAYNATSHTILGINNVHSTKGVPTI